MNKRSHLKSFRNGKDLGSYTAIHFEIVGHTELGPESIQFDTDIHYYDNGEGEPILLIHGIGQSIYTWRNNFEFFVKNGYRVIALDLAGFGYSGHPNIYYTAEEYAMIIEAFMDSINLRKTHIVAFSTGCASAICFAADNPKRVGRLTLISPGAPNVNYPFEMKILSTWLGSTAIRFLMREASVKSVLYDMFFDSTLVTDEVVQGYFAPYRNKSVRETLSMCMAHFEDSCARSRLKDIKNRTLVFYGTEDKLHSEKSVNSYASVISGARIVKIRNCGYLLHEEKYMKFNDEMLRFLSRSVVESQTVYRRSYGRGLVD